MVVYCPCARRFLRLRCAAGGSEVARSRGSTGSARSAQEGLGPQCLVASDVKRLRTQALKSHCLGSDLSCTAFAVPDKLHPVYLCILFQSPEYGPAFREEASVSSSAEWEGNTVQESLLRAGSGGAALALVL